MSDEPISLPLGKFQRMNFAELARHIDRNLFLLADSPKASNLESGLYRRDQFDELASLLEKKVVTGVQNSVEYVPPPGRPRKERQLVRWRAEVAAWEARDIARHEQVKGDNRTLRMQQRIVENVRKRIDAAFAMGIPTQLLPGESSQQANAR